MTGAKARSDHGGVRGCAAARRRRLRVVCAALGLWCLALTGRASPAAAETHFAEVLLAQATLAEAPLAEATAENPAPAVAGIFKADQVVYDRERGITLLTGGVEIAQGERILSADQVSYDEAKNLLFATGNVNLLEPDGTVLFATEMEITADDLKNGVIRNIRVLIDERTRIAANEATRADGRNTVMRKGIYSPCELCADDPESPPLWQIKAETVTHDQQEHLVEYENVTLELGGFPVLYTPWFWHFDPEVERKTGLLTPVWGSNSNLGAFIQPRYFWAIAPDRDLTVKPIIGLGKVIRGADTGTSKFNPAGFTILAGDYRQALDNGAIDISASLGKLRRVDGIIGEERLRERKLRGHIDARFVYDLNDTWQATAVLQRVTDVTYRSAYPFFNLPNTRLVSQAGIVGFRGRNYAGIDAISIQSLRIKNPAGFRKQDFVSRLFYDGYGEIDRLGGRWSLAGEARFLRVRSDNETHRLSITPGYRWSAISNTGFRINSEFSLRTNAYLINYNRPGHVGTAFETEFNSLPKLSMNIGYPLFRADPDSRQIIEPVLFGAVAPKVRVPKNVTIEDSSAYELDEVNIFSHNRLNGHDFPDGGSRAAAGLRYTLNTGTVTLDALYARAFSFSSDDLTDERSGTARHDDDYAMRLSMDYRNLLNLRYRARSQEALLGGMTRQEIGLSVGGPMLRLHGDYIFVDDEFNGLHEGDSRFAALDISSRINRNLDFSASIDYDIEDSETRRYNARISWQNECAIFSMNWQRNFTNIAEYGGTGSSLVFRLTLKSLGDQSFDFPGL